MDTGTPQQSDIKGIWRGTYMSWRLNTPIAFVLTITTVDTNEGTFRGFITEESDLPRSTVRGVYSFGGYCIGFTKTYNTLGYSIHYDGRLLPGKAEGKYTIGNMQRDWSMEQAV